ncbi:hypothetical protein V496_02141 [Pseudogymnoascus sp. VKM F-4515 (FW-2607)]|nr:hypothetical protein V496_02141 [Pseudogymnoascus sp. VKM F-4515 (FW-2607)]
MASHEKGIPPPQGSAKAVNRGGRPRKYPPGEAKERKAAAQKQNRGPKNRVSAAQSPLSSPPATTARPGDYSARSPSLGRSGADSSVSTQLSPLRDANAQRIGAEPTDPRSGLELTPAIDDGQAGMPSLSSGDQPKSDEESDEPSVASDTREHSLWCDEDNSDSDYGCVVPSPKSLSFKVERELGIEAMMMKSESPSPISSRASYFADSQSDADNEEGGVLEDKNTTSEANSPDR